MDLSEQIGAIADNLADCSDDDLSKTLRENLSFLLATAADLGQDLSAVHLTTAIQRAATNLSACEDGDLSETFRGNLGFLVDTVKKLGQPRAADLHTKSPTPSAAHDDLVTTTEAASALSISRPTVMRLIESGALDHVMVGTHHRIPAQSVLAYKEARLVSRERIVEPPPVVRAASDCGYRRTVQLGEGGDWL